MRPGSASAAKRFVQVSPWPLWIPFHGYMNAIDDQLEDTVAVLDAFHVVKLGTAAVDEVRRRIQQKTPRA
ncbi:MAG: transposase [Schaalia turicensis]